MNWTYVWLSVEGRINREVYWLKFALPYLIGYLLAAAIDVVLIISQVYGFPILIFVVIVLGFWPSIAAAIKRLHDRDRSAWFLLFALVPFANIWIMIEVYFLKGTDGPNRFGPDPLQAPVPGPA